MDDQPQQEPETTPESKHAPTPTPPDKSLDLSNLTAEDSSGVLSDILKAAATRAGGPIEAAVEEFLGGKGELLDSTRSSLTRGKTAAKKEIAAFLVEKFKLAPTVARVFASLLIKLVPSLGGLVGGHTAEKPKPRRKKKKTASKTTKKTTSKTKKKPKKKIPAKKTTAKTTVRKKRKTTPAKKKPRTTSKTKKAKKRT